ncbi:MAG TPA: endonuclease/exonuclease/phosphatase family protein, partial [Burkholderiaceae bacterium]|nr:endonuclease/exonuclease/phosphatase family protein [Burkholderiaceae bacterium]
TVNIHKGYTAFNSRSMLHRLRDAVRAVGSDLVFLQEVSGPTAGSPARHRQLADRRVGDHEYLADEIWSDHAYGRNAVDDGFDHGNALLSRYPITRWHNHDVSLPGDEPRGMLHCIVQPDASADSLHVICVHLGLRESHRRHQLNCLGRLLHDHVPPDAPLVVAGDFNDWRSSADRALRATGLVEVFRLHDGVHARSFPAPLPVLRLDRIYVRHAASAQPLRLPRRPWSALSDHAPLAAEIRFAHRASA